MEKVASTSRFSFVGKAVKSGSKVSGSTTPQLILQSTLNKFILNEKAAAAMGLAAGSYVILIDNNRGDQPSDDQNERYFITAGFKKANGEYEGAKLGSKLDFSYSGIWSAFVANEADITSATPEDLFKLEKVHKTEKGDNWISNKKIEMDVVPFIVEEEDEAGNIVKYDTIEVFPEVFQKVWALKNLTLADVEEKTISVKVAKEATSNVAPIDLEA